MRCLAVAVTVTAALAVIIVVVVGIVSVGAAAAAVATDAVDSGAILRANIVSVAIIALLLVLQQLWRLNRRWSNGIRFDCAL